MGESTNPAIAAAHSKLGASSYDRWGNCFGSVRECEGVPNIESEYAKEGTLAHTVCERMLKGEPLDDLGELPDDMIPACKVYVDFVNGHNR